MAARVCLPSMVFVSSEQKGCFSREGTDLRELDEAAGGRQAFWYPVLLVPSSSQALVILSHLHLSRLLDLHTASYSAKEDVISKQKGIKT